MLLNIATPVNSVREKQDGSNSDRFLRDNVMSGCDAYVRFVVYGGPSQLAVHVCAVPITQITAVRKIFNGLRLFLIRK
ncbi:hypothetical protein Trydic_g4087 [Trypoxylus dichotomus]